MGGDHCNGAAVVDPPIEIRLFLGGIGRLVVDRAVFGNALDHAYLLFLRLNLYQTMKAITSD